MTMEILHAMGHYSEDCVEDFREMARSYDRACVAQELIDNAGAKGVPAYDLKDEEAIAFIKQIKSDDAKAS